MTGYAVAEETDGRIFAAVEMRTYNSRHLDVALRISSGYLLLEENIKSLVAKDLSRGRVEINVRIKDPSDAATRFEVHIQRAEAYYQALCRIKEDLGLSDSPTLDHILRAGDMILPADTDVEAVQNTWPVVKRCVANAIVNLNRMRETEGNFISRDFLQRLEAIAGWLAQIEVKTEGLLLLYQNRLKERINSLTHGIVEIDPARIARKRRFWRKKVIFQKKSRGPRAISNSFDKKWTPMNPPAVNSTFCCRNLIENSIPWDQRPPTATYLI